MGGFVISTRGKVGQRLKAYLALRHLQGGLLVGLLQVEHHGFVAADPTLATRGAPLNLLTTQEAPGSCVIPWKRIV